jgi:hypothetical protein
MLKHVPLKETGLALAFLTLLFAAYVGGYYSLVMTPEVFVLPLPAGAVMPTHSASAFYDVEIVAEYRFGGDASKRFFSLWHNVDRQLRSTYWLRKVTP